MDGSATLAQTGGCLARIPGNDGVGNALRLLEQYVDVCQPLDATGHEEYCLHHRPSQLSVGEQQRIAAARAIAAEPQLILADEPTGNLDRGNTQAFADSLREESRQGRTIILVTHSDQLLGIGNRSVELAGGQIVPAVP